MVFSDGGTSRRASAAHHRARAYSLAARGHHAVYRGAICCARCARTERGVNACMRMRFHIARMRICISSEALCCVARHRGMAAHRRKRAA